MEQFNDMYDLENARYQTTADEIKPYKNITTKHTFKLNGKLYNDVNHKAIEMNKIGHPQKTVLTKHQNKPHDRRVDIALYDIRNQYGLNAQNALGNHFQKELNEKRIENITLPHGFETLPINYQKHILSKLNPSKHNDNCSINDDEASQEGFINDYLSNTNNDSNPYSTDERLERMKWMDERQTMSEGDRIKTAQLLRDSDMIKERNQRQAEANLAGKKHGFAQFGLGRLASDSITNQLHINSNNNIVTDKDEFDRYKTKNDISLYHEEYTGTNPIYINDISKIDRYNNKETFNKSVNNNIENDSKDLNKDSLIYSYDFIAKRGKHKQDKRKAELNKVADDFLRQFISDYDYLLQEYQKDNMIRNSQRRYNRNVFEEADEIDSLQYELETLDRDKTIRLLKHKDIITEYDNEDVPAVVLDVKTSTGNVPMKLFATKAKKYLNIIRDDNIDFENNIDVVKIPIETLPKKIKNKVKKSKERTVSLNFEDWNDLLKISYNGRFEHDRVKKDDIMRRLQDNEIEKRINEGFDVNYPILTDSRTIETIEDIKNNALLERQRTKKRIDYEKDFKQDEQILSFDRTPDDNPLDKRTTRINRRAYTRNPSIWKQSF